MQLSQLEKVDLRPSTSEVISRVASELTMEAYEGAIVVVRY